MEEILKILYYAEGMPIIKNISSADDKV